MRRRLDQELVRRGLVASREQARALILDQRVLVSGSIATKAARLVDPAEPVELAGPPPRFVGRGGEKLDAALERFGIDVDGLRCLDAGASTGGFTDCLLQRGAAEVVAVDVGHGQLDLRLREDSRVVVMERTNVRHLSADDIGGVVPLVVADLSFISLATVTPALLGCLADDGHLVALVKPQFEAGREAVSRGRGVVRDRDVWRQVLERLDAVWAGSGAVMMEAMASPLRGADGNVEFLAHVVRGADAPGHDVVSGALSEVDG